MCLFFAQLFIFLCSALCLVSGQQTRRTFQLIQIKVHKMSVDDMNPFFKIDIIEEAEDTFVDDDSCDTQDDIVYEEHRWPLEDSIGFSFKLLKVREL